PYAAQHNPCIFFQDVSGNPPSQDNEYGKKHTKSYSTSAFAADLAANKMANYVFITPNLCNDMHGDPKYPEVHRVTAGDKWLSSDLPRVIDWVNKNSGVLFIAWDEGSSTTQIPYPRIISPMSHAPASAWMPAWTRPHGTKWMTSPHASTSRALGIVKFTAERKNAFHSTVISAGSEAPTSPLRV